MTDLTSHTAMSRSHKPPRAEFRVYFALIFLLALPLALLESGADHHADDFFRMKPMRKPGSIPSRRTGGDSGAAPLAALSGDPGRGEHGLSQTFRRKVNG